MRGWRWHRRSQRDFEEEIQAHLALEADRLIAQGMTPADAAAAARRAFGSVALAQECFYESHRALWAERLARDLRYALRSLRASPGFTAAALATLAFGIGVNTAIITLIYAVALRPLPVRDADRVVNVYQELGGRFGPREVRGSGYLVSYPEYADYRDRNRTLAGLAVYREEDLSLGGAQPAPVRGLLVSCNYFQLLAVRVAPGRPLAPDECARPGGSPVAVLSHGFWRRQFGGDSAAVGRSIVLNGLPVTVVGVAERAFAGTGWRVADVFLPVTMHPALAHGRDSILARDASWLTAIGRLRPGVTPERARADLAVIAAQRDAAERPRRRTHVIVSAATYASLPTIAREGGTMIAAGVLGLALLVIAMACANVMNLLLARAAARRRELAIRAALGAARSRLVGQLFAESVLLAVIGGAIGLALTYWLPPLLLAAIPAEGLRIDVSPDLRVLSYALAISLAAALAFGLSPALRATRLELTAALRGEDAAGGRRVSASRLRNTIVGVQVAGSVLLLAVAALLVRAISHAQAVDPGFDAGRVIAISLDVERRGLDAPRSAPLYDELERRLAALPGAEAVARAAHLPLLSHNRTDMTAEGTGESPADSAARDVSVSLNVVSGSYFAVMGVPLVRGRTFDDAEVRAAGTTGVRPAVVSEAMAARVWPSRDPLGRRFVADKVTYEVVGVARDIHHVSLERPDGPFAYLAAPPDDPTRMLLLIRAGGAPGQRAAVAAAVPRAVRELDGDLLATIEPFEQSLARMLQPMRVTSLLVTLIGALATALALVGVYGVISYGVTQRTREIGVRIALGAPPRHVLALVMRQGGRVVLVGAAAGLALAAGASQVLRGMLFGVSALDPLAFIGTAAVVAAAALLAMYQPARRATRIDPAATLRAD